MEYIVQVLLSAPQQPSYVRSTYVCMGSVLHSRSHCLLLSHTVNHRCYHNKTRFRCLLLGSWLLAAVPRNEQTAAKEYFPLVTSEKSWITTVVRPETPLLISHQQQQVKTNYSIQSVTTRILFLLNF